MDVNIKKRRGRSPGSKLSINKKKLVKSPNIVSELFQQEVTNEKPKAVKIKNPITRNEAHLSLKDLESKVPVSD